MALNDHSATYEGTGPTLAAPATTQVVASPDEHTGLLVVIGATATTVTIVRPGNDEVNIARPDKAIGPLTNTTRLIRLDRKYYDPAVRGITVQFSQVTAVTASVVRL